MDGHKLCLNASQRKLLRYYAVPGRSSPPGSQLVGTEQLLLGLLGEETGVAAKVLKSMGVNLKDVRIEVENH